MTNPFLTVSNIRLIERQIQKILSAKMTTKDRAIQQIIQELAVTELTDQINVDKTMLEAIAAVSTSIEADLLSESLKRYTIPFQPISEKELLKLFSKEKKLKLLKLTNVNWHEISYLSWIDRGTNCQYIVIEQEGKHIGVRGAVQRHVLQGMCTICHQQSDVHLFTTTVKGTGDAYTSYSNYICTDAKKCNSRLTDKKRLENFILSQHV